MFKGLLQRRNGTNAIECALIAGFLVLAIVVAAGELENQIDEAFGPVAGNAGSAGD